MTKQGLENIEPFVIAQTELEKQVTLVAEPIVLAHDCELVHVKIGVQKKSAKVTLYIDGLHAQSSVTLDQLEFLNRLIGDALDVIDAEKKLFSTSYQLEVSSPGLDRALAKKSHFEAAIGKLVRLKTDSQGRPKVLTSRLQSLNEQGVSLQSDQKNEVVQIPWSTMRDAHVIYEFPKQSVGKNLNKSPLKRSK